jgi:hypothetical protein
MMVGSVLLGAGMSLLEPWMLAPSESLRRSALTYQGGGITSGEGENVGAGDCARAGSLDSREQP